ncbi:hypothetical protein I4U23_009493 [Adineta vaga]|nr:hypothetical protein I4U23_009493 [Adineta vaga]
MEKRVHSRKNNDLTCRHYMFHFKWPLFGLLFMITFVMFIQINVMSMISSAINPNLLEIPDTDVMYPTDVLNTKTINTSINYYFSKKDELKFIDDANAANKQQKIVLPLIENNKTLRTHLILEYTNVFDKPRFCSHTNEQIFGKTCPYTNCKYTCNRTYENQAQVLLMHKQDLDHQKLDTLKRNSDQIWLL